MATILSFQPFFRNRAPGSTRLAQWLDELAPVLLLAAVVAILAVAAHEAHAVGAAPALAVPPILAE
ncbi:MAG TPA: hypothetical protein VLS49_13660 [Usitatibacter sp.]|nr:hypothetical protein [Usitatibacter sp.]